MTAITRAPIGAPSKAEPYQAPATADWASDTEPGRAYEAKDGMGALKGLQIGWGDGGAVPEQGGPSQLPPAVQMAAAGVQLQVPATTQAKQAASMRPAAQPQPLPCAAALSVPRPAGLATNTAVLKALHDHAMASGTVLSPEEIKGYVALGEHAVDAIRQPSTPLSRRLGEVVVHTVNPPVVLSPNMETARAISWYVAACAAQQDVNQKATGSDAMVNGEVVTNLTVKGAYVFKDPGNAIYNFLQSSPLAYPRVSTHFNERSASGGRMFWKPEQRGIEDYQRRLPGQNGSMLFDKLQGAPGEEEMFLKFESVGTPTSAQTKNVQDKSGSSLGQALWRWIQHAVHFIESRSAAALGVDRKEHVHKGLLKSPVYEPFMKVMQSARRLGLGADMGLEEHGKLSKSRGLPHLEETLARLKQSIGAMPDPSRHLVLLNDLVQVQAAIIVATAELGAQSDHLGIVRRGAETHVDLKPPQGGT